MDATPNGAPGADDPGPADATRYADLLVDALKAGLAAPGEHRLFRAAKLPGLFPTRAGAAADAALYALKEGLLETVRTETRGKVVTEWVRVTPRGVTFVHDHDSPKSVLRELKELLDVTRAGVPVWMDEARQELATLSARFEERAAAVLDRLGTLAGRVEAALRRAEANTPAVGEPVGRVVPWALECLEYLDRRAAGGAAGECPLPELFHAVRARVPGLTLPAFHDGIRRLHDVRAVRLASTPEMAEPEYAAVLDGKLMYAASR